MAWVPKPLPEEQENQFARTAQTTPFPQGAGSAGSGAEQAPGMGTSTQFGSNAAKLTDYLKANADQVGQFGTEIAGSLNQSYQDTLGQVDQGMAGFNQSINQGYTPPNQDLVNRASANPTEFVKNQGDVDSFRSIYNNQYSGPQNFESSEPYSALNSQVNKAVENAALVKTPAGTQTYLTNAGFYPNATGGIKSLDAALLAGNKDAQKSISDAASKFGNLNDYLSTKGSESNAAIASAKQSAEESRNAARAPFVGDGGFVSNLQNTLNQRVADQQSQATNELNSMNALISKGTVTPEDMQRLGMNDQQRNKLYSDWGKLVDLTGQQDAFDPRGYFNATPDAAGVNASTAGTADDYAMAAALAQLTGQPGLLNQEDIGMSGSVPIDTTFDIQKALEFLEANIRRFQPPPGGTGGTSGGVLGSN